MSDFTEKLREFSAKYHGETAELFDRAADKIDAREKERAEMVELLWLAENVIKFYTVVEKKINGGETLEKLHEFLDKEQT